MVLRTLVAEELLSPDAISASTVRRLYVDEGLARHARRQAGPLLRADRPGHRALLARLMF